MRFKRAMALMMAGWFLFAFPVLARAESSTSAKGACTIEISTGRILYEKNADAKMPMASTTKIMTAIVAIENGDLDEVITIPEEGSGIEGSSLYLKPGEQFTLRDLLYGMMLQSGNDAAVNIAIHIGGSVEGFSAMMNEKAKQIGAVNSNFTNPHGLNDKNHYTTARDLAMITAYAMKDPTFAEIVGTQYYEMIPIGAGDKRTVKNKNKLLWNFADATGVKTGYTSDAGKCYVGSANRNGMHIVTVVLSCPDMWKDAQALLEDAFSEYRMYDVILRGEIMGSVEVGNGIHQSVAALANESVAVPLKEGEMGKIETKVDLPQNITAPVMGGDVIGSAILMMDGKEITQIDLIAEASVYPDTYGYRIKKILRQYLQTR